MPTVECRNCGAFTNSTLVPLAGREYAPTEKAQMTSASCFARIVDQPHGGAIVEPGCGYDAADPAERWYATKLIKEQVWAKPVPGRTADAREGRPAATSAPITSEDHMLAARVLARSLSRRTKSSFPASERQRIAELIAGARHAFSGTNLAAVALAIHRGGIPKKPKIQHSAWNSLLLNGFGHPVPVETGWTRLPYDYPPSTRRSLMRFVAALHMAAFGSLPLVEGEAACPSCKKFADREPDAMLEISAAASRGEYGDPATAAGCRVTNTTPLRKKKPAQGFPVVSEPVESGFEPGVAAEGEPVYLRIEWKLGETGSVESAAEWLRDLGFAEISLQGNILCAVRAATDSSTVEESVPKAIRWATTNVPRHGKLFAVRPVRPKLAPAA